MCRNAQELLKFHERFVAELRDAVDAVGFRGAFAQTGEESPEYRSGEDSVTERVERAVEVVAAKLVNEVSTHARFARFRGAELERVAIVLGSVLQHLRDVLSRAYCCCRPCAKGPGALAFSLGRLRTTLRIARLGRLPWSR